MFRLARFLRDFKKQVILGPLFKLTEAIFELIVPLVMAQIIDVGIENGDRGYVLRMGGVLLLLGVVGLCCALVCQYFASVASQGFGTKLRNALFDHINSFSHAEIDKFGTPSLITRMTNDINQLQYAVAMLIRLVVRAPFLAIGALVMAISIDWKLSLVFLAAVILIVIVLYLVMGKAVPFYRQLQKKLDKISLIARENLEGNRVIRAFAKQDAEKTRFAAASEDCAATAIRVGKISALLNPATTVIINVGILAVVWFGAGRVNEGDLLQGQIIALVNYMMQILLALIVVANLVVTFTKASACATRVNEVFDTSPSVTDQPGAHREEPAPGTKRDAICFDNVSFAYVGAEKPEEEDKEEKYALRGLSFTAAPGETIGIIGGTGSGKSTLVNLIPRFYDVTHGAVRVDGQDVRTYPLELLRSKIGMVPQRATLFAGTIADNLRWRKPDATEEEMERALKIAQAWEFVQKLPDGLLAPVTQGGRNFSGGQRQRLTIARALVGEPEILILDDSASALDFATDAALRRSIKEETKGMTVLIVSQRASSIRRADQIIVLDDGVPVGIGKHEQLLDSCQVYHEICLSQLSEQEARR
ncbi:MAG TPA: ABC transporter ATP-binding protein [Candidatus Gallacutalibacter stercoravium]|nr:ABC transporter ATP-binding protein [Candidatus Gallacutalibacter stercoravium]